MNRAQRKLNREEAARENGGEREKKVGPALALQLTREKNSLAVQDTEHRAQAVNEEDKEEEEEAASCIAYGGHCPLIVQHMQHMQQNLLQSSTRTSKKLPRRCWQASSKQH